MLRRTILGVAVAGLVMGQGAAPEYEVKAAYIYNLVKFVEWPPASQGGGSPITVAIIGRDPFGQILQRMLDGKQVNGRGFKIVKVSEAEDIRQCQIVFFGTTDQRSMKEDLKRLEGTPALTVGEGEEFSRAGGIIAFIVEKNRVRFEVNIDAMDRAQIKISSYALQLARIYREPNGQHKGRN